jgi:hypothetical protein
MPQSLSGSSWLQRTVTTTRITTTVQRMTVRNYDNFYHAEHVRFPEASKILRHRYNCDPSLLDGAPDIVCNPPIFNGGQS